MKRLLLLLLLLPLFTGQAHAEDLAARAMEVFDARGMESGLSKEESEISGELDTGRYDAGAALTRLGRAFLARLRSELAKSLGFAAQILGLLFFCAFACAVCAEEKYRDLIEVCAACALAALLPFCGCAKNDTTLSVRRRRLCTGSRTTPKRRCPSSIPQRRQAER